MGGPPSASASGFVADRQHGAAATGHYRCRDAGQIGGGEGTERRQARARCLLRGAPPCAGPSVASVADRLRDGLHGSGRVSGSARSHQNRCGAGSWPTSAGGGWRAPGCLSRLSRRAAGGAPGRRMRSPRRCRMKGIADRCRIVAFRRGGADDAQKCRVAGRPSLDACDGHEPDARILDLAADDAADLLAQELIDAQGALGHRGTPGAQALGARETVCCVKHSTMSPSSSS